MNKMAEYVESFEDCQGRATTAAAKAVDRNLVARVPTPPSSDGLPLQQALLPILCSDTDRINRVLDGSYNGKGCKPVLCSDADRIKRVLNGSYNGKGGKPAGTRIFRGYIFNVKGQQPELAFHFDVMAVAFQAWHG